MIRTYSEILTAMCDSFDSYIAPKKIRRDTTNFIYLVLQAIAKGYEIINSTVIALGNKFNPELCSDADLLSIAKIAGTKKKLGSFSGLIVIATNSGIEQVTLYAGTYIHEFTASVKFTSTVVSDVVLAPSASTQLTFFSDAIGEYRVTESFNLNVTRTDLAAIHGDIVFAGQDNVSLLGADDETNIEFRKRILNDTYRQDTIKELELDIANLPYILDSKVVFNQTADTVTIDGISVPSHHILLSINGDPRDEIAAIVASKGIYPTVMVNPAHVLYFNSDIFIGGKYPVYYRPFTFMLYDVELTFNYDPRIIDIEHAKKTIEDSFARFKYANNRVDYITEALFYDLVRSLFIPSLNLLDVTLYVNDIEVPYVDVPSTRIPRLDGIVFTGTSR
jgi:hypothetical protein